MKDLSEKEFAILKALLKRVINEISDIFTNYICDDTYSDNRAKKRNYLTGIECRIYSKVDDILASMKPKGE